MNNLHSRIGEEVPHLRRYARSLVGCPATADDLAQACVERALTRESQWDPTKGLRPWLFRILRNLHISTLRSRKRESRLHRLENQAESYPPNHENTQDLDLVREALEQLPDSQREIILLVAVEGLSYEEAASILDVPAGTVRSRLSRARENLREHLKPGVTAIASSGEGA